MSEVRELVKDDGYQKVYRFANGYGASVVCGPHTYGGSVGLFELAVLKFEGKGWTLTYDTPITNDVEGHLTQGAVDDLLDQIAALP